MNVPVKSAIQSHKTMLIGPSLFVVLQTTIQSSCLNSCSAHTSAFRKDKSVLSGMSLKRIAATLGLAGASEQLANVYTARQNWLLDV